MDTVIYGLHTVQAPYEDGAETVRARCESPEFPPAEAPMRGRILVRMPTTMEEEVRERARAEGLTSGAYARRTLARALRRPLPKTRRRLPGPDRGTKMLGDAEGRVAIVTLTLRDALRRMDVDGHLPHGDGTWSAGWFRDLLETKLLPTLEVTDAALLALLRDWQR